MKTKAIILRVLLPGVQLVCGCAHFEPAPMDPAYGVTPPGYVSAAFREGNSMEPAVESPRPFIPSIVWSRAEPAEPVSAGVADEPAYGIGEMFAEGTVNFVRAFIGGARTKRVEGRHSTVVVAAPRVQVVQPAPQIVVHKVAQVEHPQSKPKPVEHKPVHHKSPEHKPAQPKPSVNKSAPAKESKKKQ